MVVVVVVVVVVVMVAVVVEGAVEVTVRDNKRKTG